MWVVWSVGGVEFGVWGWEWVYGVVCGGYGEEDGGVVCVWG